MTDMPRQQLHYIITHYGRSVCDEPKRCEALLKDLCPQHKREVNLLVGALREGVAKELLKPNQLLPMETVLSRLSHKLHDELGFEIGLAQWAVESWALALGVKFNSVVIAPSPDKGKAGMGLPQSVTPIMPVNQYSQAIIDPFKGWQKIGLNGEKLAVDAPQWAAVVDEKTKLMWAINPSKTADFPNPKSNMTWNGAQEWAKYANRRGWCGYKNWRLPTIDELKTLLLPQKHKSLFIREDVFVDICDTSYRVWSSSLYAFNTSGAWVVGFGYGNGYYDDKYVNGYVRLVRSSQ